MTQTWSQLIFAPADFIGLPVSMCKCYS